MKKSKNAREIVIMGCGVMGSAFARHFAKGSDRVVLCDRNNEKASMLAREIGAIAEPEMRKALKEADLLFLAIKPKDLDAFSKAFKAVISKKTVLVSILSGVSVKKLKASFPNICCVRAMPNLAVLAAKSVIGFVKDPSLTTHTQKVVNELFAKCGFLHWLDESMMEAFTALTGSGPAFVLEFIEAMIEAGIYMGFSARQAEQLVLQTVQGTEALLTKADKHPAELKWQICSPGGITIHGLRAMGKAGMKSAVMDGVIATFERSI